MKLAKKNQGGFSLVELTIVIAIIGVLAMLSIPRYTAAVERAKAAEAFTYLAHIEAGQSKHLAREGRYATSIHELRDHNGEADMESPEYFSVGGMRSGNWQTQWKLTLTRKGDSAGFGRYSVVWTERGYKKNESSISSKISPIK